jgi:hypothetical protein
LATEPGTVFALPEAMTVAEYVAAAVAMPVFGFVHLMTEKV